MIQTGLGKERILAVTYSVGSFLITRTRVLLSSFDEKFLFLAYLFTHMEINLPSD